MTGCPDDSSKSTDVRFNPDLVHWIRGIEDCIADIVGWIVGERGWSRLEVSCCHQPSALMIIWAIALCPRAVGGGRSPGGRTRAQESDGTRKRHQQKPGDERSGCAEESAMYGVTFLPCSRSDSTSRSIRIDMMQGTTKSQSEFR